jgi:hypothetical protein
MTMLGRFTTEYVAREDRIRVTATDRQGQFHVLWLTRLLMDRMLAALFKLVDSSGGDSRASALADKMIKAARQEAATAQLTPGPPVVAPAEQQGWLVTNINLKLRDGVLLIQFSDDGGHSAYAEIGLLHVHQWLAILFANYRRGGWESPVWTDWFVEAQAQRPAAIAVH